MSTRNEWLGWVQMTAAIALFIYARSRKPRGA
jgi:hypothetical protein